jgi:membrane protease YdiL (CAAX protease family)
MSMTLGPEVLTEGPPHYEPETSWAPVPALLMTALIALAPGIAGIAAVAFAMSGSENADGGQSFMSLATWQGVAFAASVQILSLVLVWVIAGRGGERAAVLRMTGARFTPAFYAIAALLLILTTGILEFILYKSFAIDIFADTAWLREGLSTPTALGTFVIAVILAPLWEELTFRGFLLSALSKTRLGFWGAALVANVLWTSLHGTYSWAGVVSVFVAGLILSWLVWRTGSIKPAIVTHAIGNLFALAFTYGFAPHPLPVPA